MTTTETDRIEQHAELAEAVGPAATKLMQHIPPDWTKLATKIDLANLGTELRGAMERMEGRITGQIAKFAPPIVLTLTGLGLTVLGLSITLIVSGTLNAA